MMTFGIFSLVVAFTTTFCAAQTPPGFEPKTTNQLTVTYGTTPINPAGITVPAAEVANPPNLGLSEAHSNGPYVVIMMDISIETTGPSGQNTTLLHWIIPSLSSSNGSQALTSSANPIAPYFPPGPLAGQTHTYVLFLYDEPASFTIPSDYIPFFANLTTSLYNRIGFNISKFTDETHLGSPIAADYFLVTNSSHSGASPTNATASSTAINTSPTSLGAIGIVTHMGLMMGVLGAACLLLNM